MSNKTMYNGGPKSYETKAISSRNSITHGLTARQWLNTNEQSLFDMIVEALMVYFDPKYFIEKMMISKHGELSGNSFRVGAALDLLDKNIPLEKIMLRGGWKSETSAIRYLQSWSDKNWTMM